MTSDRNSKVFVVLEVVRINVNCVGIIPIKLRLLLTCTNITTVDAETNKIGYRD